MGRIKQLETGQKFKLFDILSNFNFISILLATLWISLEQISSQNKEILKTEKKIQTNLRIFASVCHENMENYI